MQEVQQKDHFIGRIAEIKLFENWLADPESPSILYIHDAAEEFDKKGGVGKTRLLHKCVERTLEASDTTAVVMVDFFNVSDRDRVFLAQRIIAELERLYIDSRWSAKAFNTAMQLYLNQDTPRSREEISAALAEDIHRLDIYLAETQKTLLVIFDTFETIEQNPSIAVLSPGQTFPDNYQFAQMRTVIAGRNRLDWTHPNWRGREQDVQTLALEPFSQQEMQEYIKAESVYEIPSASPEAHEFYERTEGRPIIIGLAIDVLNRRILSLQDLVSVSKAEFERYLVPQVNKLEEPLNWVILFMAHVHHRFNMSILDCILESVNLDRPAHSISREALAEKLPRLSFVRQSEVGDNFVLHDEMRRLVTRYCWEELDPDGRFRRDISRSVIGYYEQELTLTQNEQQHQRSIIEILYHRLFVDLEDGFRYFLEEFSNALRLSQTALARLLLQEVQSFAHDLSLAQQMDMHLAEAKLFRSEDNPSPALVLLGQLRVEADGQWRANHWVDILVEEGRCYQRQSRLAEATDRFTQCLEIARAQGNERQTASYLSSLGLMAYRRGQFATSLDYYEQGMVIFRKLQLQGDYADSLMSTAVLYRRIGKLEEALRRGKVAWQMRLHLFQAGKVSETLVASALHGLGLMYFDAGDIIEAEKRFNEMYDIYLRNNNKVGIIRAYSRFGAIELAKGRLESAQAWFIKSEDASRDLNAEQYINSLNKQGNICLQRQQWNEAAAFFKRAIDLAHPIPDYFQETESLIDLADALEHMGQNEDAHQELQQAEAIASREDYAALLGQIEHQRAEVFYREGDYKQAFQHFALYCQHMLEYNYANFIAAIQKVVDALLGMPKSEVTARVQELRVYWAAQQLDETYPELIQACEELDNFMI